MLPPSFVARFAAYKWLLSGIASFVAAAVAASLQQWAASAAAAFLGLVLLSVEGFLAAGVNRVGAALMVAPFTSCVALAVARPEEWWLLPAMMYAYFFGLLGIPAYFVFKRLGWLRVWQVVAAGAALGAAIEVLLFGPGRAEGALPFSAFGALTSTVFWVLAFAGFPRSVRTPKE